MRNPWLPQFITGDTRLWSVAWHCKVLRCDPTSHPKTFGFAKRHLAMSMWTFLLIWNSVLPILWCPVINRRLRFHWFQCVGGIVSPVMLHKFTKNPAQFLTPREKSDANFVIIYRCYTLMTHTMKKLENFLLKIQPRNHGIYGQIRTSPDNGLIHSILACKLIWQFGRFFVSLCRD